MILLKPLSIKNIFIMLMAILALTIFLYPDSTLAQSELGDKTEVVYYFEDSLCPVCADQKKFLKEIQPKYQFELKIYSISNTEKFSKLASSIGVNDYQIMAPTTFIGNNFFQFNSFTDYHEDLLLSALEGEEVEDDTFYIKIPFIEKQIDVSRWSLPALTVVLGSLDGFNVCSLGALILILSIVLVFDSRKKIFFFGGLFILTTAMVYGLLVFVWGRLFELLVGQLEILRIIVGLAALGGGIYFFKEFLRFKKHGPTCNTSNSGLLRDATKKLQKSFDNPKASFFLLTGCVALFAVIITIIELPCSIGIPIAFTGILVERGLSLTNYTLYIIGYIFFYLLIEVIIFTGAILTKKIWFAGSKMITWTTFIGALILFYLSFYYLTGI